MHPGGDPYFVHAYRIDFDGKGLTASHLSRQIITSNSRLTVATMSTFGLALMFRPAWCCTAQ